MPAEERSPSGSSMFQCASSIGTLSKFANTESTTGRSTSQRTLRDNHPMRSSNMTVDCVGGPLQIVWRSVTLRLAGVTPTLVICHASQPLG